MWNNSYRTPTECWQKTSDFPKGKKHPTYLGRAKEKRKKTETKSRDGICTSGRELWRRKSFHTLGRPFTGRDGGWAEGKLWSHGGEHSNGCREQSGEIPTQRMGASQHSPAWEACLLTRWGGWGLGAESWGSGPRGQIPGRGLGLAAWTQPEGR